MNHRFAKFALVGLLGIVLQLSLLTLFTKMRMSPITATPLAVELTVLHNFLWHERFTWRDRQGQRAFRLVRFQLANGAVSLFGNTAATYCLVSRLHAPTLPSALIAIAICSLANFALSDRWVYRLKRDTR